MDWVFIEQLEIDTVIGIHPHEQHAPQALRLSLRAGVDNRVPAGSQAITDTLDYHAMAMRLRELAQGRSWLLIETLIEACAEVLRDEFGVGELRLRIDKPQAVPEARSVGIIIERRFGREGADE